MATIELIKKKFMKQAILTIAGFLIFLSSFSQTKEETMEWINEKLNNYPNTWADYECTRFGGEYTWGTSNITSRYLKSTGVLKITFLTNYMPEDGGVESKAKGGLNNYRTNFTVTFGSDFKFTRVVIGKPSDCNVPKNTYKITFFSKKNSVGEFGVKSPTTSFAEIGFAINLGYEDDLPARLQKAFDQLISFSQSKEAF